MNEKQYENPVEGYPAPGGEDGDGGGDDGGLRDRLGLGLLRLAVHLPDHLVDVNDLVLGLLQHLLGWQTGSVARVPVAEADSCPHNVNRVLAANSSSVPVVMASPCKRWSLRAPSTDCLELREGGKGGDAGHMGGIWTGRHVAKGG